MRLTDSKDALCFEGVGMLAFGLVALCYTGQAFQTMLSPLGILLLLNGLARISLSAWFYDLGSSWRRLSQAHGSIDISIGIAALLSAQWGWTILEELFATWLLLSGYFHLRRFHQLKPRWPQAYPIQLIGTLSIIGSALLLSKASSGWPAFSDTFLATAAAIGVVKLLAAFKLGKEQRRSKKEGETLQQQKLKFRPPFSPLNLN